MNAHPRNTKQDISLRVYRPAANGQQIIFDETFEHSLANTQSYPILRDGDVFVMDVTHRQPFSWRDATTIVSSLGVLALAIERLTRASR